MRSDQYGVRAVIGIVAQSIKFKIILEARIGIASLLVAGIPV